MERVGRVERDLWEHVCTQTELAWLYARPRSQQQFSATLTFCAKECLYKCQYPVSHRWLDFRDVQIDCQSLNLSGGMFEARCLRAIASFGSHAPVFGRYAFYWDFNDLPMCIAAITLGAAQRSCEDDRF
jgi:4'-phosphopantetheinyl transferase EntD